MAKMNNEDWTYGVVKLLEEFTMDIDFESTALDFQRELTAEQFAQLKAAATNLQGAVSNLYQIIDNKSQLLEKEG